MLNSRKWLKSGSGRIVSYFLQGMLLIAPAFVTIYAIFYLFNSIDSVLEKIFRTLFNFYYPGVGIVAMFFIIALIGFIGSLVIVQPIVHIFDLLLEKTPVVKDVYSSLKDFFGAFISNKKKFNKPVMFELSKGSGVFKLGFITQNDLLEWGIQDKVAIYTPLSYNLSGIMYVVNRENVQVLKDVKASELMKFIVSGGVTAIDEDTTKTNNVTQTV